MRTQLTVIASALLMMSATAHGNTNIAIEQAGSGHKADLTITGSGTKTVNNSTASSQTGDANTANLTVNGATNTIYFAQSGNSTVAVTIDGDSNVIKIGETIAVGGDSTDNATDIDVFGDGNQITIDPATAGAIADVLDIDVGVDGAPQTLNIIAVKYAHLADITASILGDSNNVLLDQDSAATKSTISLQIGNTADADANILKLYQKATASMTMTVNGSANAITTTQQGTASGSITATVDIVGGSNTVTLTQNTSSASNTSDVDIDGSGNTLTDNQLHGIYDIDGSNNTLTANRTVQTGTLAVDMDGDGNSLTLGVSSTAATVSTENASVAGTADLKVQGDSNALTLTHLYTTVTSGEALDIDVLGNSNTLTLNDSLMTSAIVNIDGDSNQALINQLETAALNVKMVGNDSDLFIDGMDTGTGLTDIDILAGGNELDIDNLTTTGAVSVLIEASEGDTGGNAVHLNTASLGSINFDVSGKSNTVDVTSATFASTNLTVDIDGNTNDFDLNGAGGYGSISATMEGDANVIDIDVNQSNKSGNLSITLTGSGNTVDADAGEFTQSVTGDNFNSQAVATEGNPRLVVKTVGDGTLTFNGGGGQIKVVGNNTSNGS